MVKQYSVNGLKGCVEIRRIRATKLKVGLYYGPQAGIESELNYPWVTVCEQHGSLLCHATMERAKQSIPFPDWCEACQKILYKEHKTAEKYGLGYMQGRGAS